LPKFAQLTKTIFNQILISMQSTRLTFYQ